MALCDGLNDEMISKWISALLSGRYEQSFYYHYRDGKYSPIGVLVELMKTTSYTGVIEMVDEFFADVSLKKLAREYGILRYPKFFSGMLDIFNEDEHFTLEEIAKVISDEFAKILAKRKSLNDATS